MHSGFNLGLHWYRGRCFACVVVPVAEGGSNLAGNEKRKAEAHADLELFESAKTR